MLSRMKAFLRLENGLQLTVFVALISSISPAAPAAKFHVIGYFAEAGPQSGNYTVKNVATSGAGAMLTELDYAFGRVADNQCQIANREPALNHFYAAAQSVNGKAVRIGSGHLRGPFHQ